MAGEYNRDIHWRTDDVHVHLTVGSDGLVRINHILPRNATQPEPASQRSSIHVPYLPLVELRLAGPGNGGAVTIKTSRSLIGSITSNQLQYKSHREIQGQGQNSFEVAVYESTLDIEVVVRLSNFVGTPVVRCIATVYNKSHSDIVISQISSIVIGGLSTSGNSWEHDYTLHYATNSWFREAQWHARSLNSLGLGRCGILDLNEGHHGSLAQFSLSSRGTFSTGTYLPMGLLSRNGDNSGSYSPETWLWQVESNGSWRWEIGDHEDGLYVAAGGPTARDHDWREKIAPGQSFTSVPVAVCHVLDTSEAAFAALTSYRRKLRRRHDDNEKLPVIFNDYMNCLMGDPDEKKVLALLEPVVQVGAEYFVIDAGWYADDSNWWDDVGEWEPSMKRFPSGFKKLLDAVRSRGLVPGVWVEPEVVGVRSIVAKQLPDECFFQEHGARVVEKGRYQLDFRHPLVRERMHKVIRKLVVDYGVGYFKFDYNIDVTQGTDVNTYSAGAAELGHNRAYLAWVNELFDLYPALVIESCSSGAQRMDYAMLATHSLQSTSDQQHPSHYSVIAAAVPTAVTPEQSASWAYPQPEYDDELNAFTMVNAMLGRMYLSGGIQGLSEQQLRLVSEGVNVYKSIRRHLATGLAFWPLGLPQWNDDWVSLGMVSEDGASRFVAVWRRSGSITGTLPIKGLAGETDVTAKLLFPSAGAVEAEWDAEKAALQVTLPESVCARLFQLTAN